MKRSELLTGLRFDVNNAIVDLQAETEIFKHDHFERIITLIDEAIKELEGTRSIEEVRERIEYHDMGDTLYSGRATRMDEDRWFLKEGD